MIFEGRGGVCVWGGGACLVSRNFLFISHCVQEFFCLVQNTSRNFCLSCNIFSPSEYDAGYFFRSPVAAVFFTRTWLAGNFFSKKLPCPP